MGLDPTITAAMMMTTGMAGIAGSIWWAQRDRSLDYTRRVHLGRSKDMLSKNLDKLLEHQNKEKPGRDR